MGHEKGEVGFAIFGDGAASQLQLQLLESAVDGCEVGDDLPDSFHSGLEVGLANFRKSV